MKLAVATDVSGFHAGVEDYLCASVDDCSSMVALLRWRAIHQAEQKAYSFLLDGESDEVFLTYRELDRKARSLAARLQEMNAAGERALLLYPPGLDYVVALFACLYAGTIAVPAYPPRPNQRLLRLAAIIMDAQATLALTTALIASSIERHFDSVPALKELRWLVAENVAGSDSERWQDPFTLGTAPAFLQYTSGSTGTPKGVIVTRDNLMHNSALIKQFFQHTSESSVVFWTPPYHDMGLIGGLLQPLYCGIPVTLISPFAFLQRPLRWLQAISRTRATTSGGPNFAYEMCVQKITSEQAKTLDLSSWDLAFCGAEPVRAETLARFAAAFEPCGFRPEAFYPCYGLAEATLIVTGGRKYALPITCTVQGSALAQNRVAVSGRQQEGAVTLIGCGKVASDQQLIIVSPDNCIQCEPDEVGEIWISGPSVADGYWRQPEATKITFDTYLSGTGEGPFLRTGDLGFLRDGELYVVGRLKDLIIIDGLNHHPEDIEFTAERSHPALRPGCGAAFGVEVNAEEKLVIVYEVDRHHRNLDPKEVSAAIRKKVAAEHQVQVHEVVLVKHGSILKTSSGKVQRHACREVFLSGSLNSISDTSAVSQVRKSGSPPLPGRTQGKVRGVTQINPFARRVQRYLALIVVVTPLIGFLIAFGLLWQRKTGFIAASLFLIMYVTTLLGIEAGFHRHFAHRAFQANRYVRGALAILGSMAAQGPLIFWVAIHRRHHAYSDQPGDPHSPNLSGDGLWKLLRGIWHAHVGWLFDFELTDWVHYAPDLLRERGMFQIHRLYPLWVGLGLFLPAVLGSLLTWTWSGAMYGFLWGGLARVFMVHHSVWSVNSLCHFFGQRPFKGTDHSTNNFWLTLTSLGGSWHNNHHAFPRSAKNSFAWWQLDPSAWFIKALETVGLAWDVNAPTQDTIERARASRGVPPWAPLTSSRSAKGAPTEGRPYS